MQKATSQSSRKQINTKQKPLNFVYGVYETQTKKKSIPSTPTIFTNLEREKTATKTR